MTVGPTLRRRCECCLEGSTGESRIRPMCRLMVVSAGLQAKPQLLEDPEALRAILHKMLVPAIVSGP